MLRPHTLLTALIMCIFLTNCQKENEFTQTTNEEESFHTETVAEFGQQNYQPSEEITTVLELISKSESEIKDRSHTGIITRIPSGSRNVLQAAIDAADERTILLLESGPHYEDDMIMINKPVRIYGQRGARLILDVEPFLFGQPADLGMWIRNAPRTVIYNIQFEVADGEGGIAIFIESSDRSTISTNQFDGFIVGVANHRSDRVKIKNNVVNSAIGWASGAGETSLGIVNMNGETADISHNTVTQSFFGIWACDKYGTAYQNETSGNLIGLIVCKVPNGTIALPDGRALGSTFPGSEWRVFGNSAHDNLGIGYLVIDGANNNYLFTNQAENNQGYDYEITGLSERFGFPTPPTSNNRVKVAKDDTVKDCGNNNWIIGGIQINTTTDPCN